VATDASAIGSNARTHPQLPLYCLKVLQKENYGSALRVLRTSRKTEVWPLTFLYPAKSKGDKAQAMQFKSELLIQKTSKSA
jgi:hypothetical protein